MTLRRAIKRLRLKPGDVVLVRDPNLMKHICDAGRNAGINFPVPVIFEPRKNDIQVKK